MQLWQITRKIIKYDYTVEPLNKGHIGIRSTVPCREAVLIPEVKTNQIVDFRFLWCQVCPYFRMSFIRSSNNNNIVSI